MERIKICKPENLHNYMIQYIIGPVEREYRYTIVASMHVSCTQCPGARRRTEKVVRRSWYVMQWPTAIMLRSATLL